MIIRVIDFETRGLPPDCEVVEVATVDLVEREVPDPTGEQVAPINMVWERGSRMWSSLVNPGKPIPAVASAIHHITDEMVKDAPMFPELILQVLDGADVYASHNSRFEVKAWQASVVTVPPPANWIDTYRCSLSAWRDAPAYTNQALRYWLGLKLAGDPGPPHRALGDAYVTAAILRRLLSYKPVETLLEISAKPARLPFLTFGEHAMKPMANVPTSYLDWIVNKSRGSWDEDVMFTAVNELHERRQAAKARSPV